MCPIYFWRQGGNVIASLCHSMVKRRIGTAKVVGAVNEIVGMYAEKIASDGPAIRTGNRVAYYVANRSGQLGGTEVLLSFDQHFIFTNRDASLHI